MAKKRRKYIEVAFSQVMDGWIISGLREGFVKVSPDFKPAFDHMVKGNCFWPYRLRCEGFIPNFQWWCYEVSDTGEGQRVTGE